jgi:hypothetical protein
MADEITLTIPRQPEFRGVASFVLGGLAARLNLTIESLEDIQLALDALLARAEGPVGDVRTRWSRASGRSRRRCSTSSSVTPAKGSASAESWTRRSTTCSSTVSGPC